MRVKKCLNFISREISAIVYIGIIQVTKDGYQVVCLEVYYYIYVHGLIGFDKDYFSKVADYNKDVLFFILPNQINQAQEVYTYYTLQLKSNDRSNKATLAFKAYILINLVLIAPTLDITRSYRLVKLSLQLVERQSQGIVTIVIISLFKNIRDLIFQNIFRRFYTRSSLKEYKMSANNSEFQSTLFNLLMHRMAKVSNALSFINKESYNLTIYQVIIVFYKDVQ